MSRHKPLPKLTAADVKRFWAFVDKSGDCWLWAGQILNGYGFFQVNGSRYRAHRIAWYLYKGEDPGDQLVRHKVCDNRKCVNPAHLKLGTDVDNAQDKVEAGRCPKGEKQPMSKLTEKQAQAILDSDKPHKVLAAGYGVAIATVNCIKTGRSWKHLKGKRYNRKLQTGIPGVTASRGKWLVQITFNLKHYYLGRFDTKDEAIERLLAKRLELGCDKPRMESIDALKARFKDKFTVNKDTGCWEWKRPDAEGYGTFTFEGKLQPAHRVSHKIFIGEIPEGQMVRHKVCDNRKCVNPAHLKAGTAKDNGEDMVRAGRSCPGEKNGNAKLTNAQTAEIQVSDDAHKVLATKYGVTRGCISDIIARYQDRGMDARTDGLHRSNKSGVHGVCWYKRGNCWKAKFNFKKKRYHVGYFDDKFEAEKALIAKRAEVGAPAAPENLLAAA